MAHSVPIGTRRVNEALVWLLASLVTLVPVPIAALAFLPWIVPPAGVFLACAFGLGSWRHGTFHTARARRGWTLGLWVLTGGAVGWAMVLAVGMDAFMVSIPVGTRYAAAGILACVGWILMSQVAYRVGLRLAR